jgi:hypothetical protein
MRKSTLILSALIALLALALWPAMSQAYSTYSAGKTTNPAGDSEAYGNCKTCHGHFRATDATNSTAFLRDEYISPTDNKPWREMYTEIGETEPALEVGLHDIHRHIMVDEDTPTSKCQPCHGAGGFYPVILDSSASTYFTPIGCMGCHGRTEDGGNDNISGGLGAGLRQHHTNAGVPECKTCHRDADPANYTPVGENVSPPYYFTPDAVFVNKPTDPCSPRREEDYAGKKNGLDNDGDGRYDKRDPDCKK